MDVAVSPKLSDLLEEENSIGLAISIMVPTRNEADHIETLLSRISQVTRGIPAEVVFVDDSNDYTPEVIRSLKDQFTLGVTLIACPCERHGNGLSGAVIEAACTARAPWVCVMDTDLPHPPELIPRILGYAKENQADLGVGRGLAPGGSTARQFGRTDD